MDRDTQPCTPNHSKWHNKFRLGYEAFPIWFKSKVQDGTIELTWRNNCCEGCRFYDVKGRERNISAGYLIYYDMLYKD